MTLNGGDGVIYLSTIEIAEDGSNSGFPVVTNRIVIGSAAIAASRIAAPATVLSNGEVADYENDPLARATIAPTLTLVSGDISYAVEAYHTPTDIPVVATFFGQQRMTAAAYY
jgi:hypothetical protein